MLFMTLKCIW